MAAAPSVQTPTSLLQLNSVFSKKSINTWKTSAAFDVVSEGWQKRNFSLILSSATYLIYTSSCERLETSVASSSWRAKTGEELIFDITLLLIFSDISWIRDFIVSLDSEIRFIVWDAFSWRVSHFPISHISHFHTFQYAKF